MSTSSHQHKLRCVGRLGALCEALAMVWWWGELVEVRLCVCPGVLRNGPADSFLNDGLPDIWLLPLIDAEPALQ